VLNCAKAAPSAAGRDFETVQVFLDELMTVNLDPTGRVLRSLNGRLSKLSATADTLHRRSGPADEDAQVRGLEFVQTGGVYHNPKTCIRRKRP
jgi:hypothetical protein